MSCPYVCPLCNGRGELAESGIGANPTYRMCNACDGRGIVWEPTPRDTGYDPFALSPSERSIAELIAESTAQPRKL